MTPSRHRPWLVSLSIAGVVAALLCALTAVLHPFQQPDHSRMFLLLLAVYPAVAVLTGVACELALRRLWVALAAGLIAFSLAGRLAWHGNSALVLLPLYVLLALAGYGLAAVARRLLIRSPSHPTANR
jgi:hypothetical protein